MKTQVFTSGELLEVQTQNGEIYNQGKDAPVKDAKEVKPKAKKLRNQKRKSFLLRLLSMQQTKQRKI